MTEVPGWARWGETEAYTLGVEEEVMLVEPGSGGLAQVSGRVLPHLSRELRVHAATETHMAALELDTAVHPDVPSALAEVRGLRAKLDGQLAGLGLAVAAAGTHPLTVWSETRVSEADRHQAVFGSMRELARREPTFALHVHVGVPEAETALRVFNRMRVHLPVLLALSANSPFWQGRDSGLASARTPLFQAFPRVGIPRPFADYTDWACSVDLLVRCDALPDHTFLWWDIRLQPRYGTVEIRIMDAQTTAEQTASLVAFTQCLVALEADRGFAQQKAIRAREVLEENRFLAARDGVRADLVEPLREQRVPVPELVGELREACAPYARQLGCERELAGLDDLLADPPCELQRRLARGPEGLAGLVGALTGAFSSGVRA